MYNFLIVKPGALTISGQGQDWTEAAKRAVASGKDLRDGIPVFIASSRNDHDTPMMYTMGEIRREVA